MGPDRLGVALALALVLAGCAVAPSEAPLRREPLSILCADPCGATLVEGSLWEPTVVVDPTDASHWVASSQVKSDEATGRSSWALSHVSFDAGRTWTTLRLPGGADAPPGHPLRTTTWMDDSVPVFLPDGTLVWTVLAFEAVGRGPLGAAGGSSLVALRSHDGGLTFPDVVVVARGSGGEAALREPLDGRRVGATAFEAHDKQWVTRGDDGELLLAWSQNLAGRPDQCAPSLACTRLLVSTSRDGLAWAPPRVLVERVVSGAFPLVLADGAWLVSYHLTEEQEVAVARSTDRGETWTTTTLGPSTKFPVLARAPAASGERVHLAYPKGQDGRDGAQAVAVRWSDDGGASWSDELVVATPEEPGRTLPGLAAAPDGGAFLAFWSPEAGGARYLAVRLHEGRASAPLELGRHEGPTSETGDYMGLAPIERGAVAVWTATSDGSMRLVASALRDG